MDEEISPPHTFCHDCNKNFEDSFALIDHYLEDDEDFDPYYILPNGYKLMLGSLMRFMFSNCDKPDQIKLITQSTYVTLFASEMGYSMVDELVEDTIVKSALVDFDAGLAKLLGEPNDDKDGA